MRICAHAYLLHGRLVDAVHFGKRVLELLLLGGHPGTSIPGLVGRSRKGTILFFAVITGCVEAKRMIT